ncbi:MAG TPA: glycosyltransferase [Casimicrobiaceae bacterium]|nr:glycosyltransferase [Casimicrobiaceae bacterium]
MPAILFYVQHLLGIGHLARARAICAALAATGADVHLVTGGRPAGGGPPGGVRTIQLPPIHVADAAMTPLLGVDGTPIDDVYRGRRRDMLLAAYDSIAPDAVVFETFPFGRRALQFELLPLVERIAATRPRPLVVASVRDVLQRRRDPEREREALELARRAFDAVLVHGDRRFMSLEETFPLASELDMAVRYTGFVESSVPARPRPDNERAEIVVSGGGGAIAFPLMRAALAARPRSSHASGIRWRLLIGTNAADAELEALARAAGPGVIVERARADFPELLAQASISVSQAGYNTVLDVVRSGARPVLVPFADHGETEQRTRANRLRDLDLAIVVDVPEISGADLSAAIDAAAAKQDWGTWDFDCGGAARSAAIITEMIERDAATVRRRA